MFVFPDLFLQAGSVLSVFDPKCPELNLAVT
jgi:hypothetical protein